MIEILVGGADDADVDLDRLMTADALDHLVLQEAQQLDLHRQRHVADFVEEEGAAIGALDLADGLLDGAGEGALFMAEQFTFEQGLGDRGAVDRDERLLRAVAHAVDGMCQHLLAGAALAEQQNRDVGGRDLLDRAQDAGHLRARCDDPVHRRARRHLFEAAVLCLDRMQLRGPRDHQSQHFEIDRLVVEIVRAELHRAQRHLTALIAGGDDDLGVGRHGQQRLERRHALGHAVGIGRQPEIEYHDGRPEAAELGQRVFAVAGLGDFAIGECPFELAGKALVVLDDQNGNFAVCHGVTSRKPRLLRSL